MSDQNNLVFLKLGGSILTDKTKEATLHLDHLNRLAAEVKSALNDCPGLRLLIGHGSGSFGHFAGRRFGTRDGVSSLEDWIGYAHVGAAAARLNRFVMDALLDAGVPALNLQPSASARCEGGELKELALHPLQAALDHGLVPVVHGDVAVDTVRGGTILSTEEILIFLAPILRPGSILLASEVAGVMDDAGMIIPRIRVGEPASTSAELGGSHGVDVTGGMFSKVSAMLDLVSRYPEISVRIFSGATAGTLQQLLTDPASPGGTWLTA